MQEEHQAQKKTKVAVSVLAAGIRTHPQTWMSQTRENTQVLKTKISIGKNTNVL